nr:MAG TPA: hypothetical protein [Caudoviricetes sp.]
MNQTGAPVVFDPSQTTITIDNTYITGLGESPISFDYSQDAVSATAGLDGGIRHQQCKAWHLYAAAEAVLAPVLPHGGAGEKPHHVPDLVYGQVQRQTCRRKLRHVHPCAHLYGGHQ